jgi:hypothetical protein
MVNMTTASQRDRLEKLWVKQTKKPQLFDGIFTQFYAIFQSFIQSLTTGEQPRVWQVQQQGTKAWNAYDPVSQCRVEGLSESEMRAWLEHRYNQ